MYYVCVHNEKNIHVVELCGVTSLSFQIFMRSYSICVLIFKEFYRTLISNPFPNWSKIDLLSGRADFISRKHVVMAVRYQNKLWYVIADNNSNVTMGPKPFNKTHLSFYPDFIQILSRFYPDFFKLTLSRFYPNF